MDARRRKWRIPEEPVRSAHERWKDEWGAVKRWSALAAVAAHLAIFAAWPTHEVNHTAADSAWNAPQLVQLAAHDLRAERPEPVVAPRPEDLPPRESDERDDLLRTLAAPLPSLAGSGLSSGARPRPEFAAYTGTVSAPKLDLRVDPAYVQRSFTWPEILNPREMIRFLRTRYNPIHTHTEAERFVSVAIWINENGAVEWCDVHESSGHPVMDEIALTAVNKVLAFSPAQREGMPVAVAVVLSIPFQVEW
jgi:TonB family protein